MGLTREQLAAEAGTDPGRVDELVRIGVIHPSEDGAFSTPDIARARLVDAYESAGIDLDLIRLALERRWITFERIDDLYADLGPKSGRSVASFRESLGPRGVLLAPLIAALGLPNPSDELHLRQADELRLEMFMEVWDVGRDPDVVVRAGRLVGEAMRRMADGWLELFAEHVTRPLEDQTRTIDETSPIVLPRAASILRQTPELLTWLFQRHLEVGMDAQNISSMEAGLAREGLLPPRPSGPQAIAFVDLAGYTRLTETGGASLLRAPQGALLSSPTQPHVRTADASSSCSVTARCFIFATRAVPSSRPSTSWTRSRTRAFHPVTPASVPARSSAVTATSSGTRSTWLHGSPASPPPASSW